MILRAYGRMKIFSFADTFNNSIRAHIKRMKKLKDFFDGHKKFAGAATVIAALLTGVANGLFGGGGGMLAVPAYTVFQNMETKRAHATAVAAILPLSVVSAAVYITNGNFEPSFGYYVCGGVIIGGIAGSFFLKKISSGLLEFAFYGLMLAAGIRMLTK